MINTVHWSEPDDTKADVMRRAAGQLAEERNRERVQDHSSLVIERTFNEADDSALARLCDILRDERA